MDKIDSRQNGHAMSNGRTRRLNYARAKALTKGRRNGERDYDLRPRVRSGSWRGLRETWDGEEFPVTVTKVPSKTEANDKQVA